MGKTEKNFRDLFDKYKLENKDADKVYSFNEYLDLVKENAKLNALAHQRIYQMICDKGTDFLDTEGNIRLRRIFNNKKIKTYSFFTDDFFGIEKPISKIVRYFHSAAKKGEESRQVLFLVGPVGAGKSSIIEKIKEGLEGLDPVYYIKDCPIRENPLNAIPKPIRTEVSKILGTELEGDLCPVCRHRLETELDGDFEKFEVAQFRCDIKGQKGVGMVPPVDPNNQDTSVLIGAEDISKLDRYTEDDPRILTLNGAFNNGNRGIVEFIEVFKNEIEYLHVMLTATQEKRVPAPGKHPMIYFDGVILAHSNEAEWNKFKSDHTNEAILDRIVKIEIPYVLELSEEIKIYEKMINRSNFDGHVAPHTLEIASMFAILTRLKPSNKCDLITKLKLYNGEEVTEKGQAKQINVRELTEEHEEEGMTGISTRFIMKAIDNAFSDSDDNSINPILMLDSLQSKVKEEPLAEDVKKAYLAILKDILYKEYLKMLEEDIAKAFVHAYEEQAETLFQNYLDHVEGYVLKKKLVDSTNKEEIEPDVEFLTSIEEQIGITATSADGFRKDVMSYTSHVLRKNGKLDYQSYEPLKNAIERKLMNSVKDLTRIIVKTKTRDKKQREKYNDIVSSMKQQGYTAESCEAVLKFAANHLWKD